MKKLIFLAAAFLFTLVSCGDFFHDDFFSTSLGKDYAREFKNPNVSTENLDSWVKKAKSDPKLAAEIAEACKINADNAANPGEKAAYVNGGISAAVSASGTGRILFSDGFDDLTEMAKNGEEFDVGKGKNLVNNMLDSFKNSDAAKDSAGDVVELAKKCIEGGETPVFSAEFVERASVEEVSVTMMLLVMSVVAEKDIMDKIDSEEDISGIIAGLETGENGAIKVTDAEKAGDTSIVLAAYLNLVSQNEKFKDDMLAGSFAGLFGADSDE